MCFPSEHLLLPLLVAKSGIWYRDYRAQELRLPPNVELLLQIVAEANQLWFVQESAVHQHSRRPSGIANPYGKRQVWITRYRWAGRVGQVWRHNCIEIIGRECVINSGARCIRSMCSRRHVNGIVGITAGLFR